MPTPALGTNGLPGELTGRHPSRRSVMKSLLSAVCLPPLRSSPPARRRRKDASKEPSSAGSQATWPGTASWARLPAARSATTKRTRPTRTRMGPNHLRAKSEHRARKAAPMIETETLLEKCPRCGAWSMAAKLPKPSSPSKVRFRCATCGHQEFGRLQRCGGIQRRSPSPDEARHG
jgi:hypothetical protein